MEIMHSKEEKCFEKNVFLIPGEKILQSSMLINYFMSLTNYRLYLICRYSDVGKIMDKCCHIGIPRNLILKIEQVDFKHLSLWTKVGSIYKLSFDCSENCNKWLKIINDSFILKSSSKLFAFRYFKFLEKSKSEKWLLKSIVKNQNEISGVDLKEEFIRMKFLDKSWKITNVNSNFQVCNSYPRFHIVPKSITDEDIKVMAEFRGNKRFPSVVWRSQKNGSVIIRCAQPQPGLMFWRNSSDETFFHEVVNCLKFDNNNNRLLIIDARHFSTAQLNRIRGGGVEYSQYYGEAEIVFMQLENIHSVRSSFDCISIFSMNGENWLTSIENSYWLKYLSKLLKSACDIARALDEDGRSVIIHCSDGWDRTPQLTSLSQILLDEYYRTLKGFKILIEREWIHFGHKFSDRCDFYKSMEWSPIFVQWLDCIHQLIRQYPCYFEFNETFLIKLALHVYSGLFGNFLFNTEEERENNKVYHSTVSIWSFLSEKNEDIINPLYYKFSVPECDHECYKKVIYPKYHTKFILPWNRLFFEALNPPDIHKIFSLDHSTKLLNISLNSENEKFFEDGIINKALSKQNCVRKSKSETDLSVKCDTSFESQDQIRPDSSILNGHVMDNDMSKYNGTFINQSKSSISKSNEININGFSNENNSSQLHDDDYYNKRYNFQPIELMAYSNGNHSDISINVNGRKTDLKSNLYESENNCDLSVHSSKKSQAENQYFRLKNFDDSKEIGVSRDSAPCDLDGLYRSVEPINILAKYWKHKFEGQESVIKQLKEKSFADSNYFKKTRCDSTSSGERIRNEDSTSSFESYVIFPSCEHADFTNSKLETNHNFSPKQNQIMRSGNIPLQLNSSKSLNSSNSLLRRPNYNQQPYYPCETGNSTEKAQA